MANKPLQSIKFPGLSDTYTTPQVDATLTTTGAAADAKKVGDEITSIKEDLSDIETEIDGQKADMVLTKITGLILSQMPINTRQTEIIRHITLRLKREKSM